MPIDPELIAKVLDLVERMEFLPGYPKTLKGLEGYTGMVCRTIQDQSKLPGPKACSELKSCEILIERALDQCEKLPDGPTLDQLYRDCGFRPKDQGPIPAWVKQEAEK